MISDTGYATVRNRIDSSVSPGEIVRLRDHTSIRIQETYNKVVTVSWYTLTSVSYTCSW